MLLNGGLSHTCSPRRSLLRKSSCVLQYREHRAFLPSGLAQPSRVNTRPVLSCIFLNSIGSIARSWLLAALFVVSTISVFFLSMEAYCSDERAHCKEGGHDTAGSCLHSDSVVTVKDRFNTVSNCFTDFCTGISLFIWSEGTGATVGSDGSRTIAAYGKGRS